MTLEALLKGLGKNTLDGIIHSVATHPEVSELLLKKGNDFKDKVYNALTKYAPLASTTAHGHYLNKFSNYLPEGAQAGYYLYNLVKLSRVGTPIGWASLAYSALKRTVEKALVEYTKSYIKKKFVPGLSNT